MNDEIITYLSFNDSTKANIIRSKLEFFNIPCFLENENSARLIPGGNYLLGGSNIKLKLFVKDVSRANEILKINNGHQIESDVLYTCPACGSNNVKVVFNVNWFMNLGFQIMALVFAIPVENKARVYCRNCDKYL